MVSRTRLFSVISALFAPALAGPLKARQSFTTLSATQVTGYKSYTYYASAAYCTPSTTANWTCGAMCKANAKFVPIASGGDGTDQQFWFVGFDPALNTIIVSHQGTDTSSLTADLTDADIFMGTLDPTLFPGVSSSVKAHDGFMASHSRSASAILSAVKTGLSKYSTKSVTIVGHSLGAALAILDGAFLPLHLPSGTTFKTIGYGTPRVGNQAFADYVDAHVTGLTRITNKEDPVPILPGRFLGFHHPSGEVHIQDSGAWMACPGQDNTSSFCSTGAVPNIFESTESNHDGPYDGITMGC